MRTFEKLILMHFNLTGLALAIACGTLCGPLGVWLLSLQYVYATESTSHALLPALVLTSAIGGPLLLGASVGVVLVALLLALASIARNVATDASIAAIATGMLGLGALLAGLLNLSEVELSETLFGNFQQVSTTTVAVSTLLAIVGLSFLYIQHRKLVLLACFGTNERVQQRKITILTLLTTLGLAVVITTQTLGAALLLALLILPAATALYWSCRVKRVMIIAALLASGSGCIGVTISTLNNALAGPLTAIILITLFAGTALLRSSRT